MVKFGERLPQLMHKGWAQYYLDYDALKKLIETSGTVDARASEAFFALLKKEILKVDDFVQKESARIQTEKDKAMKASGAGLSKVRKELATLRNFVGTNIIAATKIVKKHDKNAAKELQRGHEVSALVCGGPGMTNVLSLHAEIDKASGIKSSNSAPKDVSITIDKDDDESEEELRRCRSGCSPSTRRARCTRSSTTSTSASGRPPATSPSRCSQGPATRGRTPPRAPRGTSTSRRMSSSGAS